MANNTREKLFAEFPPVPTDKWEEVIAADLKGADYERKLVWRTGEGFNVRPYYRAENLEGIRFLGSQAGEFPYVRGTHPHNRWHVHQTVTVCCPAEANAEALKLLDAGVDSLGFRIEKEEFTAAELDTLLAGIRIPAVELVFGGRKSADIAELVLDKIERMGLAPEEVHMAFAIDPLVKGLAAKGCFCSPDGAKCFARIAALVERTKGYKHVRIVTVAAETFGNAGSTIVEELAFALSAGNEYLVRLTDAGIAAEAAARKLRFAFSVTSNYFMEIAKLRAARMLWANIVKGYGPEKECACKMQIHAETSRWNQTVYDPYVNMLRGTTEAMSAAIGGVHSLEVTPFDASFESPTEFSKRIARNVELLLKHESHFDQVVDPAGGSYYIENLTQSIAAEAWKLFLEIEGEGRLRRCLRGGLRARARRRIGRREGQGDRHAPPDPARRQPVSQLHGGRSGRDRRRVRDARRSRGQHADALPRRDGLRGDASRGRPLGQAAEGLHAHLRQPRDGTRTRPVLVQLLRLRRHPRGGQHLLQIDRGGRSRRSGVEGRDRGGLRRRRRLRHGRTEGQGAARRQGDPRRGGRTGLRTRTRSTGHHQLHQREVERARDTEVLP